MKFDYFHRELTINGDVPFRRIVKFSETGTAVFVYDEPTNSIVHAKGLDQSVLISFCSRHYLRDVKFSVANADYFNQYILINR